MIAGLPGFHPLRRSDIDVAKFRTTPTIAPSIPARAQVCAFMPVRPGAQFPRLSSLAARRAC